MQVSEASLEFRFNSESGGQRSNDLRSWCWLSVQKETNNIQSSVGPAAQQQQQQPLGHLETTYEPSPTDQVEHLPAGADLCLQPGETPCAQSNTRQPTRRRVTLRIQRKPEAFSTKLLLHLDTSNRKSTAGPRLTVSSSTHSRQSAIKEKKNNNTRLPKNPNH